MWLDPIKLHPNTLSQGRSGFTLLEVIVALTIVGIAIGASLGILGNCFNFFQKVEGKSNKLTIARQVADEAYLGLLGKGSKREGEEKVWEGILAGTPWKVVARPLKGESYENYTVFVGGVKLSGIRLEELKNDEDKIK